jgi:hypothetical protein
MNHPEFFNDIPHLVLTDPLAHFLGASEDGVVDFSYLDAVKLAGHSCPTVASAYWLTWLALKALYGDRLPERGAIRVQFRERLETAVTGVVANVVSLLTGASAEGGFKGLGGRFARRDLLSFAADLPLDIRFSRTDNRAAVDVAAHLQRVAAAPEMPALMQLCMSGRATDAEQRQFGMLWQDRVRRILTEHRDDPEVFVLRRAAGAALP